MTKRHYVNLGKLLCVEYPDIAKQLTQKIDEEAPVFSDLSLLPDVLLYFCQDQQIPIEKVKGVESGSATAEKTQNKHVFVAVAVKLFSPATLGPTKDILTNKLRYELSQLLATRGDRISRIISNVRLYLRVYKDFNNQVEESYTAIIKNKDAIKESKKG